MAVKVAKINMLCSIGNYVNHTYDLMTWGGLLGIGRSDIVYTSIEKG